MSDRTAPPPLLVITGMHRSGTSFAASLLGAAGLSVGDRLLGGDASNEPGHFEDLDFLAFHQRLLAAHGCASDGFVDGFAAAPGPTFRAEAEALVALRRQAGRAWGWKDPRTALLLDFWLEVAPEARFLFVYRPPWDVVDSLYRRGDPVFAANPLLALRVWIQTNARICDFARRHPDRVLVRDVAAIAAAPDALLADIRDRLAIPVGDATTTFRPGLLASSSAGRASLLARLAPECLDILRTLDDLAAISRAPPSTSESVELELLLDDWHHRHAATRRAEIAEADAESERARRSQAEREAQATAADGAARVTAAEAAAEHLRLRADRAEREARDHVAELAVAAARLATLEAAAHADADRERHAADQRGRIAALEATVTQLRSSTSWRITAPVRAAASLAATHGRPLAQRLASRLRFIVARLSTPDAARRSFARAAEILRREGPRGLVRAVRAAEGVERHRGLIVTPPREPVVRLPLAPPRPLPPSRFDRTDRPLVSIVMPVFETPADVLEATIRSVLGQTSSWWELVVVDDASSARHVAEILGRHAAVDPRIRVHRRAANGGIAAATTDGVARAAGEFVAFLDHDDLLAPEAVERVAAALAATGADALYTDQDTIDEAGTTTWTFHKPDWSPEYLRHVMYVGHLLVVRRSLAERLGFRSEFDGVQDFEFMLRVGETTKAIAHLPEVLYHWRAVAGSVAAATDAKGNLDALQARAVQEHLDRLGLPATATPHPRFPHRCVVTPRLGHRPRVSIVIPSKDKPDLIGPCLDSITKHVSSPGVEVIVVDNGTTDERALAILRTHGCRVVPFDAPFNFSAASNAGAAQATGDILVFLNNDTTVISPDWLDQFAFHLLEPDVGAVGPLLLYPDGGVQHAGVVLGARGTADHVMRHFPADADGYAGSLSSPREVSAVTGACLAIRRDAFDRVGGWNELYATHYQDVDLCLKLRRAGLRCLVTPRVRLIHHEGPTRGATYDLLDRLLLLDTWGPVIAAGDPAYPAACSLDRLDYSPQDRAAEAAHG